MVLLYICDKIYSKSFVYSLTKKHDEESLDKAVYIPISEYNKFSNRTHLGFSLVRFKLKIMMEELRRQNL